MKHCYKITGRKDAVYCTREATFMAETLMGVMYYCTRHANKMRGNLLVKSMKRLSVLQGLAEDKR